MRICGINLLTVPCAVRLNCLALTNGSPPHVRACVGLIFMCSRANHLQALVFFATNRDSEYRRGAMQADTMGYNADDEGCVLNLAIGITARREWQPCLCARRSPNPVNIQHAV